MSEFNVGDIVFYEHEVKSALFHNDPDSIVHRKITVKNTCESLKNARKIIYDVAVGGRVDSVYSLPLLSIDDAITLAKNTNNVIGSVTGEVRSRVIDKIRGGN